MACQKCLICIFEAGKATLFFPSLQLPLTSQTKVNNATMMASTITSGIPFIVRLRGLPIRRLDLLLER